MPEAPTLTDKNKKSLQFIEDVTSIPDQVQQRILTEILTQNATVEYLRRHGLSGQTDRQTFKRLIPVVAYEDLHNDITRIANGDTSPILSSHPISEFLTSMYSQMLCGLCLNKEVLRVGAVFASGFIRAIRFLEKHWSLLTHDIRTGTLNSVITDPLVRESVMKILKPDPNLADFIEFECSRKSWQGIITRIWPNTKYVDVIVTGSMAQYIPTLDYYSNELPLVCTMYASSECYFGVNLNPLCNPSEVAYTLIPTMAYFEFLPVHRNVGVAGTDTTKREKESLQLVDLADVKIGLYRYRVGDVLKVVGFKNKAPQFSFICRKNVALSIDSDKTDEVELHKAVENAVNHLVPFCATLTEYTSYADTTTIPGHYVIFWEVSENGSTRIPASVFEDCCLTIEESLNSVYRQGRASDKSIGALEIKIVENGTFDKLMDYAISLGASINQYFLVGRVMVYVQK
ncbi:hypothetical protein L1987_08098 [Smallanthus sonchifolius]|uniref:Uncharacterized protein n=1 Tax=Smallanthus sonchifolius TaxID=185202 RepID=A0ACB9JLZ0_9ASTR|nr:hypothetical protein L1987_08098 [Smallanthus sonchifolius]